MLSNIYFVVVGKEEEAARIIAWMRETGLEQRPCLSLIEVGGKIHLLSEDIQIELSKKLPEIDDASSMKLLSCCADINHQLLSHSEKKALAFGLISTSLGTCLFITKDLQVCFDCHSFIKLTSKLTSRKIVLKDDRCFHYMQDGQCSCGNF